jgi:DNA-binding beta-propeller fold protein YncE
MDASFGGGFWTTLAIFDRDARRRRIYAVAPGVVETTDTDLSISCVVDGRLVVVDASSDRLTVLKRLPVGEVPTGVAVNTQTNRVYVTIAAMWRTGGPDTLTVINARTDCQRHHHRRAYTPGRAAGRAP